MRFQTITYAMALGHRRIAFQQAIWPSWTAGHEVHEQAFSGIQKGCPLTKINIKLHGTFKPPLVEGCTLRAASGVTKRDLICRTTIDHCNRNSSVSNAKLDEKPRTLSCVIGWEGKRSDYLKVKLQFHTSQYYNYNLTPQSIYGRGAIHTNCFLAWEKNRAHGKEGTS